MLTTDTIVANAKLNRIRGYRHVVSIDGIAQDSMIWGDVINQLKAPTVGERLPPPRECLWEFLDGSRNSVSAAPIMSRESGIPPSRIELVEQRARIVIERLRLGNLRCLASGLLGVAVIYWSAQEPWLTDRFPPLTVVLAGLTSLILMLDRIPILTLLYWSVGAVTVLWTLAPGDTLVFGLWGIVFVGAFASGMWRPGFWVLATLLLAYHAQLALSLNLFGMQKFHSGSVHYIAGAQALVAMSALVFALLSKRSAVRLAAFTLGAAGTYIALISGARAVYVPMAGIVVLIVYVAWRQKVDAKRILALAVLVVLFVAVVDRAATPLLLDGTLARSPIVTALGSRATLGAQIGSAQEHGAFQSRLRYWQQAIDVGLANPGGAGAGAFDDVIHTYQRYPMSWSSSAHNVFFETFADGGVVWLTILVLLILAVLGSAWVSNQWSYALAAGGLWFTLAVDVTASHAYVMALAFYLLGAATSIDDIPLQSRNRRWLANLFKTSTAFGSVVCLSMVGWIVWWYTPCSGVECALARRGGLESQVVPLLEDLETNEFRSALTDLRKLYPESLWVLGLERQAAESQADKLQISREIAQRFPYQHPANFLAWAEAARAAGVTVEVEQALMRGLEVFPPGAYPYGERRMTPELYQAWIDSAYTMLDEIR